MERLIKKNGHEKFAQIVAPGAMRFLDFARLQLEKGERHSLETGSREAVLDIFGGKVSVTVEHPGGKTSYSGAGERADVFSGAPAMIYIPPKSRYEVVADTKADVGIFTAASRATIPPALLQGKDVVTKQVGRDNWMRTVHSALGDNLAADSLLAGETLNPPGNWSSYPPHKHDQSNPPNEAVLEEIYFFRVKPSQGYGFIWTYTAPGDPNPFSNVFVVEDGDTVLLPKGYHPTVAAPGYQLHYAWVLAGEERRYGAWADDPRHAWVKN
ncbi:MAG TPA: 5-deoxy-glucuronate isomerase [Terriglobia bacterium]|nr:5-deoxy-glucuronate isomerase [Terriglobia bacterium]